MTKKFIICDLSSIEYRVVGFCSSCAAIWDCVKAGRDPYLAFGVFLFPEKNLNYDLLYEMYKKGDAEAEEIRQLSKAPVLGGGFALGPGELKMNEHGDLVLTGLRGYAQNNCGVELSEDLAKKAVQIYREVNYEVVQFWADMDAAFKHTLRTGEPITVGEVMWNRWDKTWVPKDDNFTGCKITFTRFKTESMGYLIQMRLPSGRSLHYLNAQTKKETMIGKDGKPWSRDTIYYEGIEHSSTLDESGATAKKSHKWGLTKTYGGKLTENCVQAIARDILMNGCHLAEELGFDVWGVFHDEIATEVDDSFDAPTLDDLQWAMTTPPSWGPTLILDAAGYESKYYRKD